MQTPPPFHGYEAQQVPQKKKSKVVVIILAVLGVLLLCCGLPGGAVLYFGGKLVKGSMSMVGCMVNVESMKTALHGYTNAHDGKLPNAATWQKDLEKYMPKNKDMDGAPAPMKLWKAGEEWSCDEGQTKTGFMFNSDVSERKVTEIISKNPKAIAIFETNTVNRNQNGKLKEFPRNESPKLIGGIIDQRRGWFLIDVEGIHVYVRNAAGELQDFDMNSNGMGKSKFKISNDTNSDSGSSNDSGDSKSDNSN